MKSKMKLKQVLVSLLGNFLLGVGIAFCLQAQLGTDPIVSFDNAAANCYGINLGTMVTITNSVLVIIILFVYRKNLGLTTLLVAFLNQYPISLFTYLIPSSANMVIRIIYVVIGCFIEAIGCNIMINADLGMGIYDAFVFSFNKRFNFNFVYVRYVVDAIFLILTLIYKGTIGIGTVLSYLLIGNIMKYSKPYIDKIFNFD